MWLIGARVMLRMTVLLLVVGCNVPPSDGEVGRMTISGETITIEPSTVESDSIRFEVEGSHPGLAFVSSGSQRRPLPLSDDYIERMRRGAPRPGGFIRAGLVGKGSTVDFSGLPPGKYAFVLLEEDAGPFTAPLAVAILTVGP